MIGDLMLYPDAVAAVDGAPAEWYVDASAVFRIDEQLELFGGIDNLFDNKPPILGTAIAGDANTDPSLYDVIGRRFFIGGRFHFCPCPHAPPRLPPRSEERHVGKEGGN